jgi:hypothetical protein
MKPKIIGYMHPLFNHSFNFTKRSNTIFYVPNDGFFIILQDNLTKTKKAYFKSSIEGINVTFYYDNKELEETNLLYYPIYYFRETIPTN